MTETKKRKASERSAKASVEDLEQSIQEMEAELADGHGRPLTWDEVTSTTPEELARKEQRRGILPRLIRAAKVKRLELEVQSRQRVADELRAKLEPSYEAFQEKEDELRRAKEVRDEAHGEWSRTLSALQGADGRVDRVARELGELRGR